ncbi:serine hydrolase [Paenibacillus sp. MWE-103]|uniref:Serine hydrolase n=2 Tax=Paenibacillus artemisiicola TaxID=1172618 RepID=A0ABS3WE76_9BACL|nr:serine hydrolase [Paenibacillus artemisiicola]MBO7746425.1 serine hydrolase [Paenibacillus artemisiicola]
MDTMDLSPLTASIAPLNLRSCLISRHGRLVYDHYREPGTAAEPARINSCTKSVLSALVCIAMGRGQLPDAATPASAFFPRLAADSDPRKRSITLEHLLTMTAGFEWTEFGGLNSFPRMTKTPDWLDFVLELPLADDPGTRMEYNSGNSQLLAAALARAAGMPVARFAEERLFGPLGIEAYEWETDPQGVHTGGFGMKLRPLDMLKFGELYLREGEWSGEPIVPRALAVRSVRPFIESEEPRRGWYGWHWWSDSYDAAEDAAAEPGETDSQAADGGSGAEGRQAPALAYFFAQGYGGQFVYVVPSLDIVVVLTADKWRTDRPPGNVFRKFVAPLLAAELRRAVSAG